MLRLLKHAQNWVEPKITGMPRGVPIMVNDQVLGGISVSGLSEEEDEELVQVALARCYP